MVLLLTEIIMGRNIKRSQKKGEVLLHLDQMEKACDLVFAVDEKARLTYAGKKLCRLLGRKEDELVGSRITGLVSGRERRLLEEIISTAMHGGCGRAAAFELGREHFSFCVVPVDGPPSRLAFLGRSGVSAGEELRMKRLTRVVECLEESVCLTDLDHKIVYVNPAMTEMMGFTREQMEGKKATVFFGNIPGNPKDLVKLVKDEASGGRWRKEIYARRKDGTIFPVILLLDAVWDEDGRKIGYVGVSQDITEQKELQGQLVHAEKLAAIGQLASGLAHEFNNLLAIISGRAQFARSKGTDEAKDKAVDVALRVCERARNITSNLLSFARRAHTKKELSSVPDIMESILSIVARGMGAEGIKIVRRYGRVPGVLLDRGQMQQVFLNILINAHHAMPSGGTLTIRVRREGEYVRIDFTDTGSGIGKEIIGRIFEPFVTTKGAIGRGTLPGYGLGLSVSYGIVKQHGGEIGVKSALGEGSTFTVKLPLKPLTGHPRPARPGGRPAGKPSRAKRLRGGRKGKKR
ncbi:MAG: PAS domain S-box protein [Candidatus Tritonobacter lacicola]|nr:PAS domain S-box protein [Candidatus Tritonobacter lacicola]